MHDAVAFLVDGKRYTATGSGGNSDYLNNCAYRMGKRGYKVFPRNSWIATVKAGNGRRLELPVGSIKDGKYVPLPGIAWVYPPTKDHPEETVVK